VNHQTPQQATPFIGRQQELADLERLLDDPTCRFVTLLGPGGTGKTRLALETATRFNQQLASGRASIPTVIGKAMARSAAVGAGFLGFGSAASLYSYR
jgi:replication-associated recombination protein RarA